MTPIQWTMLGIALVAAATLVIAWLWCALCAGSDADDAMDDYAEEMRRRGIWS